MSNCFHSPCLLQKPEDVECLGKKPNLLKAAKTLAPTYNHQGQQGVYCLSQGYFNTWEGKTGTEPVILQSGIDCPTSAPQ